MLDQINWYFHYFFLAFFLCAALFFWRLDRKRWQDYRQAAKLLKLSFNKDLDSMSREHFEKTFTFFKREQLSAYSACFAGIFENRQLWIFNYAYDDKDDEQFFRRGFSCLIAQPLTPLSELIVWPKNRPSPFPAESRTLDAFFPGEKLTHHFKICGSVGQQAHQMMSSTAQDWLLAHTDVLVETQSNGFLIAQESEWQPDNLEEIMAENLTLLSHFELAKTSN